MSNFQTGLFTGLVCISAMLLSACATTQIVEQHKLFVPASEQHATVYFIRPTLQRTRGVADNDLTIELDDELALKLAIGEYAALDIKPKRINVTFKNLSYLTAHVMPEEVKRSKRIIFEPNKTYFILAEFRQEEFRGLYFKPVILEKEKAISLIKTLKPAGKIAQNNVKNLM